MEAVGIVFALMIVSFMAGYISGWSDRKLSAYLDKKFGDKNDID